MSALHRLFRGTARILSAELLAVPCSILILSVLTRTLGPSEFGHYVLAAAIVNWLEWTLNTIYGRATIKFVGESEDWKKVAGTVVQMHFLTALLMALSLMLFSKMVAGILKEPLLARYLMLFALDIPCWSAAQAYRGVLIARESFRERSWLSVARWLGRVSFTIPLVLVFRSVEAAICGWILCSLLELAVARFLVSIPVGNPIQRPTVRKLFAYAVPLSAFGLILRLYDKTDLFFLKILGADVKTAGFYGAAQNFSLGIGLVTVSLSVPLLGTLTRLVATGGEKEAARLVTSTFRTVLLMIPFVAFLSGASPEIVQFIFGDKYLASGPILRFLLFSAISMLIVSLNASILVAFGKSKIPLLLAIPMLPLATTGYLLLIPVYGAMGAAYVNLFSAALLATASTLVVHSICSIQVSKASILTTFLIGTCTWWASTMWPAKGLLLLAKMAVFGVLISVLLFLTGQIRKSDLELLKTFLRERGEPERSPL